MTDIRTNRASGGTNTAVACASFLCPVWPSAIHICEGFDDITAALETSESVTFLSCDFQYKLPDVESGSNMSMSIALDGLINLGADYDNKTVIDLADQAREAGENITLEMRFYLLSDLSAPQLEPERLTLAPYEYDVLSGQLSTSAVYYDFVNKAWPLREDNYNVEDYPGLKHYA